MATRPPALNLPNAITMARIVLAPVLVVLVLSSPEGSVAAAVVFAAGALGDVLDGTLARSRGLVTTVGKLLDPVADKLLVGAALIALVVVDRLWVVVPVVILTREVLVTVLRTVAARRGEIIDASSFGKIKMTLQIAMVLVLLAVADPRQAWVDVLVAATVLATVVSGIDYLVKFRRAEPAPAARVA